MVIKLRAYFAGISILTWILGIKTMCIPVLIIGWVLLILTSTISMYYTSS